VDQAIAVITRVKQLVRKAPSERTVLNLRDVVADVLALALEAQQQLFPTQLNLARTQRDQQLAVVSLYKALGGGWRDKTQSAAATSQVRH
jgi:hypothetical protein